MGPTFAASAFERGRYVTSELEGVLTGDHIRAERILAAVDEWVLDPRRCARSASARASTTRVSWRAFNAAGLPAVALDGSTQRQERRLAAIAQLRRGELQAIFTVDIFNEGVDIPEVDTLLLLRPTESATVFLQQLGRGLRWAPRQERSDRPRLHRPGPRRLPLRHPLSRLDRRHPPSSRTRLEQGFPLMPPGCAIRLDEIAQEIVLENLRSASTTRRRACRRPSRSAADRRH